MNTRAIDYVKDKMAEVIITSINHKYENDEELYKDVNNIVESPEMKELILKASYYNDEDSRMIDIESFYECIKTKIMLDLDLHKKK